MAKRKPSIIQTYLDDLREKQKPLANISREFDILSNVKSSGKSTAAAEARLAQVVANETKKLIESKAGQKVLEGFLSKFVQDPRGAKMFLGALSRGLSMGGAVAGIVGGAFEMAQEGYSAMREWNRSTSSIKDINRKFKADPRTARMLEKQIKEAFTYEVMGQTEEIDTISAAEIEKRTKDFMARELELASEARKNLGAYGIDAPSILVAKAKRLGKSVVDLSQRERNEALDAAVRMETGGLDLNSKEVNRRMAGLGEEIQKQFGLNPALEDAYRTQFAHEERQGRMQTKNAKRKILEEQAEQARENMTPAELFNERVMLEERQATWMAYRSRRAAWSNDFY